MNGGAEYKVMQKVVRGEQEKHWQMLNFDTDKSQLVLQEQPRKNMVLMVTYK